MREVGNSQSRNSSVASSELAPVTIRPVSSMSNETPEPSRLSRTSRPTLVFLLCIMSFVAVAPIIITFSLDFNLFQKVFALCVGVVIACFEVRLIYRWHMLGYFNRRETQEQQTTEAHVFTTSNTNGTEQIEIVTVPPPPPYSNVPPPPYCQSEKDIKCEPEDPKASELTLSAQKEENVSPATESVDSHDTRTTT